MSDSLHLGERTRAVIGSRRVRRIVAWAAGLVALFAFVGFFVVPPIAKSQAEKILSERLHRPVTIERVKMNPFAPSATVLGFAVKERDGSATAVSFDELYMRASYASLVRLAPVVSAIRLSKPYLRVVRNADRTYNFQDLIDEALAPRPAEAAPESDAPPRFSLNNIQVLDGRIEFDDRLADEKHEIADLKVGIPFISSLPSHVTIDVLPELAATINGAPLGVKGETQPFSETRETTLNVDLDRFDLTKLVEYLPEKPGGILRSALLDTRLVIAFAQPPDRAPVVTVRGSASVHTVDVRDLQDRPALAWKRVDVELNEVEPLAPRVSLKGIVVESPQVYVRREKDGQINLARLAGRLAEVQVKQDVARKETGRAALPVVIDLIVVKSGTVQFHDETVAPVFQTTAQAVEAEVRGYDGATGKRADFSASLATDGGEKVQVTGGGTVEPRAADGRVQVAGIKLRRYQPYVSQATNLEIDAGEADAALAFMVTADLVTDALDAKLADVEAALRGLSARLRDERAPLARVASADVKGARLDLAARTIGLGAVSVREATVNLRREKDGKLNVERIVRQPAPASGDSATTGDTPWRIDLGDLSVERAAISLEDLAVAEPLRMQIAPIQVKAENLSTAKGQRGNVAVRATIDKTGTLAASGPLTLDPLSARLRIDARTIGITPAQRYVDDKVNLTVTSGTVSAKGTAAIDLPPGGAVRASYKGDVGLTDFASIDKPTSQDLLKWKSLSLGAIDFELEPMKVSVDEVVLADFYSRVVLSAEGRLNLQELARPPGSSPPAESPAEQPKPAAASPASEPAPGKALGAASDAVRSNVATALPSNLRIGRITLQGGNVNFSDFFIKPNYSANLTGIGGAVTEITPEKAGDVDLRGKIDNVAPVEILGRINPLAQDLFLDLKASAKDIELSPLSPYAIKYAGYGIEKGKLSVNVKYLIENRKLSAENNIYLDQLTFGEKVESPTATKLPVLLAVSLLKDRNGVIDINLPISGSLDDPQFSLGGIIIRVIVNLIVKAVTAPFALLGAAFGGGEELAYVEFEPGSARLDKTDTDKLGSLAKALENRPGLKLDVAGRVDPEGDREGLKRRSVEHAVKAQKAKDLPRGAEPPKNLDDLEVTPQEYPKYLTAAYKDAKFPRPRNVIGLLKDLPVPEMENLMLANAQATEEDLRLLANARAQSAKDWLVEQGKVAPERIFLVAPKLSAEGIKDKGKPTRADFSLK